MTKNEEIGKKLKHIRELKDYSQEYIAEQLGVSIRAYSKLETGETQLTIGKLYDISDILGVSVQEILGFNTALIFNNNPTHQQGGEYIAYNNTEIKLVQELYEQQVAHLKDEVSFLRERLKKYE